MDSAGLGALIGGIRRAREADGDVAVACSRPTLTRLLHTTGFDRIVPVIETVEVAAAGPARPARRARRRCRSRALAGGGVREQVVGDRSSPSRSWTSVARNGTRTTGAGATRAGEAGEVVSSLAATVREVGEVA